MKKLAALTVFCFLIVMSTMAQGSGDLKGPEAKNRKPWLDPKPASTVYLVKGESLQGPAAKNVRPLERKTGELVKLDLTTKDKLKGPAYKNYKPWKDHQ
ncbi:hypothetical protein [Marinoscillum sp. 108]|uniref:Uncharacterized protein n=1 Tax=Marinoscillum luteum TaxID=861051 RepID=A0ABW7N515_9BACT|nr:hypothetical protein [Marinoscillum sp. 108]VXD10691.1 conserved exported hypothetical protein [Marinoscillum sp. 108]